MIKFVKKYKHDITNQYSKIFNHKKIPIKLKVFTKELYLKIL
jgi:hypothetical protein